MLSNVLKSGLAVQVSIRIIDVFVKLRQELADKLELKKAIHKVEKKTDNNTKNIEVVFKYLDELIEKKEKPRKQTGYKINKSKNQVKTIKNKNQQLKVKS